MKNSTMTQEQKDLLLKDLCARVPYGVKCADVYADEKFTNKWDIVAIDKKFGNEFSHVCISNCEENYGYKIPVERIKPYLFPMSSMTEEQREELYKIGWYLDEDKIYSCFRNYDDTNYKTHIDCFELVNWCYKNKFDINGLIPMNLALDATGLNIY